MGGRRAAFFKERLEKDCNFTNVYNCENARRVHDALPELPQTAVPNTLSDTVSADEIRTFGDGIRIIDTREPEEIAWAKDAIQGHINIPWSSFSHYVSRLTTFENVIGGKESPVLVYCTNGRRACFLKEALQLRCGYTAVFSCATIADIKNAFPDEMLTEAVDMLSPYASVIELKHLFDLGAIVVDAREPEEITAVGAFAGHINIPWSSAEEFMPKLTQFEDILGEKSRPVIIHCMNGRRAGMLKEMLERRAGYTKVFNGEHPGRIANAAPDLLTTNTANEVSCYATNVEIRGFFSYGKHPPFVIDCREEDEISGTGDALESHVNIPWSTMYSKGASYFKAAPTIASSLLTHGSPIAVYCSKGWRSGHMQRFLKDCGYTNVINCQNSERIFAAVPELASTKTGLPNAFHYQL